MLENRCKMKNEKQNMLIDLFKFTMPIYKFRDVFLGGYKKDYFWEDYQQKEILICPKDIA